MAGERPRGLALIGAAVRSRKAASMLVFGFSSGLPFALLIGTLTAWLGEAKINLATIGVLSWIGLATAFKFLWSPLVDRGRLPLLGRLGRRRSWIVLSQAIVVAAVAGLAATDPARDIGRFALVAFLGALGWATQDIAIDAWRIDNADEETPIGVMSALHQLGSRSATIVGGAFALHLAVTMTWAQVYLVMAALMAATLVLGLFAPDTPRPAPVLASVNGEGPGARARAVALFIVAVCWGWAIVRLVSFMGSMLGEAAPGAVRPSVAQFLQWNGPAIVAATVLVPLVVAAVLNRQRRSAASATAPSGARALADHFYGALVAPLTDLVARLGWGVLPVIALILVYPFCYNVWASFAYPFYLDFLHYTKDEVAFASKLFGIVMSILGAGLGGVLFLRIGRFPTVLLGAALPIFGNFVYADLAEGAPRLDAVLGALRLDALAAAFGSDERMARLLLTIAYENISTGLAGAAFVAYVSTIVSKRFSAVQYALLSSLTFLIGSLGRGIAGEAFDRYGYGPVFRWVAAPGLLAIALVLFEWWRMSRIAARAEPGDTGEAG